LSRVIVELRRSRLTLATVLRDAVETSSPLIAQSGHSLTVALPDEDVVLDADPTRLVQVLSNLLNNAAKFTPRGGRIHLAGRAEGEMAVVSVRDDGMGIPAAMRDRVFDMFTQVDPSHTQGGSGGLGIGLTVVRRLVEMHEGTVEARSEGPGTGSEFVVRLPRTTAPLALAGEPARETRTSRRPATGCRIVIADDSADAAESLSTLFSLRGHETRVALDGRKALVLAHDFQPDVMVLDIAMPALDGHELARAIRAQPFGRRMLLIAVSGRGQIEDRQRSLDAGFDHHLVKPVDFATLDRLLRKNGD
jgi:CheY-like chemotaxis protein